jgi:protein SCO1
MLRTAAASAVLVLLGWASAAWLTDDFEVWTAEGARRLAVARHPVPTPAAVLADPNTTRARLPERLIRPGRVSIIDFVYTRCATVCRALGSEFQQLQQAIAETPADDIQLLSISFDPAHDGVSQLRDYASRYRADPRAWSVVAVPDRLELSRLLAAFQVTVIPDGLGGYEHNAALLVVDGDGRLVRIFDYTERQTALDYARFIARPRVGE